MNLKRFLRAFVAFLCVSLLGINAAQANFVISPSGSTTLFAIDLANQGSSLCAAASTECAASVPMNSAGTPIFTATTPGRVDPTGTTTQPVSGTVTAAQGTAANLNATVVQGTAANLNATVVQGTAASLNATVVGTGTFAVQAAQAGAWTVNPTTIGNWGLQASTQNSATPTNGGLVLGQFNTSPTTITSGNVSPIQMDNAGNVLVNIKAGSSSGAVAQGSTTAGQTGGLIQGAATTGAPTYTTATTNPLSLDLSGSLRVNCTTGCGGGTGGTAIADEATFTQGTTQFTPIGGFFNSSITNLTSGQGGAVQLTNTRRLVDQNPDIGTVGTAAGCAPGSNNTLIQCFYQFHTDLTSSIPAGTNNIGNVGSAIASAVPSVGIYNAGNAISAEPTAATAGNLVAASFGLEGKPIVLPYANKENMVRGAASATTTGATTIIAAQGVGFKAYITGVQCYRNDAGTTAITVTFGDAAGTEIVLPNGGGGGGSNITFPVPLATAANTAFTFTAGTATTTVFCNAQGYKGA